MAVEFSVPSHTTYFAGYLDAVGRQFSTATRLCMLTAQVQPSMLLDGTTVKAATHVENMVVDFERDIASFLSADPRHPLVFYLTEYFGWYKDFSDTCSCEKLTLEGGNLSPDHFAYRLHVNQDQEVVFLASWGAWPCLTNRSSGRVRDKVSSPYTGARAAQHNR